MAQQFRFLSVVIIFSLGFNAFGQDISLAGLDHEKWDGTKIIVRPKNGRQDEMRQIAKGRGDSVLREFPAIGGIQVIGVARNSAVEAIKHYRRNAAVEYAEHNYYYRAFVLPTEDPQKFAQQWGLHNTGQAGQAGEVGITDADIDAPEAWDLRNNASSVVVAVLDTGIRRTHEDLSANLWFNPGEIPGDSVDNDFNGKIDDVNGFNFVANNGMVDDDNGHGTHVAGIIGAVGNNAKGVAGVAWQVKLMALKCLDANGIAEASDLLDAVNYAVAKGAHVINASWGGGFYSSALRDAIQAAENAGIAVVVAAGNLGSDNDRQYTYPANYRVDSIVSVAASTRRDELAYFSNYGDSSVHVAAPGYEILSTFNTSDTSYATFSGTSMAAPYVSGTLALLRAAAPTLSTRRLINTLYSNCDEKPSLARVIRVWGRVNLHRALAAVAQASPPNDAFANRITISGANRTVYGRNNGSSKELGEPSHAGNSGGASVWWSWTSPLSGRIEITTGGSKSDSGGTFDTLLAVYEGSSVNGLTSVASNNDSMLAADGTTTSRLVFTATAGRTYEIAVDGAGGAVGLIALGIYVSPDNDYISGGRYLAGSYIAADASNFGASKESAEVSPSGASGGRSVWWKWRAPKSGYVSITTHGSMLDTVLGVYTGTSHPLTPVATNDNDGNDDYGGKTSSVRFLATAGNSYYIMVDGLGGAAGNIVIGGGFEHAITGYGLLGQGQGAAVAINDHGAFVGAVEGTGFIFKNSTLVDVGTLGDRTVMLGVNNLDVAVGGSQPSAGGIQRQEYAVRWASNLGLERLDSSSYYGQANSINDDGIAVGFIRDVVCMYQHSPCYWLNGTYTKLPMPAEYLIGNARAINNLNEVAGTMDVAQGDCFAGTSNYGTLWELASNPIRRYDLPALTTSRSSGPLAINDGGVLTGVSLDWGRRAQAVYWTDRRLKHVGFIGGLGGSAVGINNRRNISGYYAKGEILFTDVQGNPSSLLRAALIENDVFIDLSALIPPQPANNGWAALLSALDINDEGKIVGVGYWKTNSTFLQYGFLMTPPQSILLQDPYAQGGTFTFNIHGPANLVCNVESASNPIGGAWSPLVTITLSAMGTYQFSAAINQSCYYRVKSQSGNLFSENAVGYLVKSIPAGRSVFALPLQGVDNRVPALFAGVPNGFKVEKFDEKTSAFRSNLYDFDEWMDNQMTIDPGETVYVVSQNAMTRTFVGQIRIGSLKKELPQGWAMISSQIPVAGTVEGALGLTFNNGDEIHKFVSGTTVQYVYNDGIWSPSAPIIDVAEGFYIKKVTPGEWRQSFSIW